MSNINVYEHTFRTRYTFYCWVTYAEHVLYQLVPDRFVAVKWFLKDGSDDAYVSVQCFKRDANGWTDRRINPTYKRISAGSVSKFITACRDYVESYFYGTEPSDDALLAAMMLDDDAVQQVQ